MLVFFRRTNTLRKRLRVPSVVASPCNNNCNNNSKSLEEAYLSERPEINCVHYHHQQRRSFTQKIPPTLNSCPISKRSTSSYLSDNNTIDVSKLSKPYFSSSAYAPAQSNNKSSEQPQSQTHHLHPRQELPIKKILVANRGEIARRIIKTCKKLNIQTVAVFSTADSKSPHVQEADEAICVGPTASSDSYLRVDNICKAIVQSGADAVHPGYGFLSENAEFASRVEQLLVSSVDKDSSSTRSSTTTSGSGSDDADDESSQTHVKFIGPKSDAIIAMGDKITSKQIAQDANVNIIPGYDGFVTSPDHAVEVANSIGYPIMIKATSGGGGKGMRICYNDDQVREGFVLSTAEAKSFFNDERLFIEKFIEKPHHIEIQLLAGRKTNDDGSEGEIEILCFPERECSIQRRNQKILEESPSTLLQPETRAEMIRQVKSLVRKVGYTSAGTVEFLVDEEQNFYFLEMNTRLQVEHPVTEMVSGDVDLVYGMIHIAAGLGIPSEYLNLINDGYDFANMSERDIEGLVVPHTGHAIEARIYAEDPIREFLPSTGPLLKYVEPPTSIGSQENDGCAVRVDSGVLPGSIISQYYDPMISKLIAFSPNSRAQAIHGLKTALDRYVIKGIAQNTSFLIDVLRNDDFKEGNTPTNFIDVHYPDGFTGVQLDEIEKAELVATVAAVASWRREYLDSPPLPCHFIPEDSGEELIVCVGGMFGKVSRVKAVDGKMIVQHLSSSDIDGVQSEHEIIIDSIEYDPTNPIVDITLNGSAKAIQIQTNNNEGVINTRFSGAEFDCMVMSLEEYRLSTYMNEPKPLDTSNYLLSPMPGTLVSYAVEDGDEVVVGQEICVVEAMKMRNNLRSVRAGKIKKCHAPLGSSLMTDEIIVEFEIEEDLE